MRQVWLLAFCGLATPAGAMSGAELLQIDRSYGTGYVMGVIEMRIVVVNHSDPTQSALRDCLVQSNITANTFYQATIRFMQTHPDALPAPAVAGILRAINEICGIGSK